MARQQSRQRRHPRPVPFEHLSARQRQWFRNSADSTARDPASVNQIEENARRPSDTEAAFCLDESVWDGRPGGAHAPSRVVSSALAGNIGRAEMGSTRASNPTAGGGCAPHGWNHSVWETVFGATPKTATGTVALPSKDPAVRPMALWGGRTGQRAFEYPM